MNMHFPEQKFPGRTFSRQTFPWRTVPWRTVPRRTVSQTNNCPNRHFPDGHFSDRTFLWRAFLQITYFILGIKRYSNSKLPMADVFWVLKIIMGPKAETYTFSQIKELLQMHENTLLNAFNSTFWCFKWRKLKNQEIIYRFEGKCPIP